MSADVGNTMPPLQLLVAAAAFSVLTTPTSTPSTSPTPRVVSLEEACPLPRPIMRVLVVLETVGVTRIDRTSKLVAKESVADTERLPVRAPSWAPASEPPTLPVLYSRMMQLQF